MRNKFLILCMIASVLWGCESSQQMGGLYMGSMLGGIFGSSIGGLMEGPRGADAGRALGMIVGGVAGVAATAPRDHRESGTATSSREVDDVDRYNRRVPKSVSRSRSTQEFDYSSFLQIENLRFMDANNNHVLEPGERGRIVFEIKNTGSQTVYQIAPVVSTEEEKRIMISPTAIVASIAPGRSVRYTAELYAKKKVRTGNASFSIGFLTGQYLHTVRRFDLPTGDCSVRR